MMMPIMPTACFIFPFPSQCRLSAPAAPLRHFRRAPNAKSIRAAIRRVNKGQRRSHYLVWFADLPRAVRLML